VNNYLSYFGIPGIDNLIGEGLQPGSQLMIRGNSGLGKTVLAIQFVKEALACRENCVYICCDEPLSTIRANFKQYGIHPRPYEQSGHLVFIDAYSLEPEEKYYFSYEDSLEKYLALEQKVLDSIPNNRPTRLVVDSLSTLFLGRDKEEILKFHRYRLKLLKKAGIITMDLVVDDVLEDTVLKLTSQLYDVIIKMYFSGSPDNPIRALHLGKMKSGKFNSSQYFYTIDSTIGIILIQNLWM